MHVTKRQAVLALRIAMCLMLLLSIGLPRFVYGQTSSGTSESLYKTQNLAKNKINPDLLANFKKQNQVTFLLKFKDQVNTKKVAAQAVDQAKKSHFSAAKTELRKRSAVVSALRAKSLDTQQTVKQFLQKQKKAGQVTSFESFYIVNAIAVTGTKEAAEKLAQFGEIEKILPNRTRHLIKDPSISPKTVSSLNPKAANGDSVEPNIEHIGAPSVWKMGIDGTGIVVANIDTGVQWNHPALKEKYRGYDPENPNQPDNLFNWFDAVNGQQAPYDDLGHGTHTMGTMVGSEPDGSNQIGVAPGAKWIAVKAFSVTGGTDVDLLEAGEWILAPKDLEGNPHPEKAPDVVNNSWGGGPGLNEWYRPMVQNWRAAGIFPVFSAGNTTPANQGGPGSVAAPSNYPESFAVGATDLQDQLADFSLHGPSPYDEIKPDVVAPGVSIRSSVPGNQYQTESGTSMAAPHVAGAVALLKQADASLTVDEIEQIIMNTTKPLTDKNFPKSPNNGYGYGLINAFNAVSAVTSGLGTVKGKVVTEGQDNEPPTYQHQAPKEAYSKIALPLQISVQDNISINKVELQYRSHKEDPWQTAEAKRTRGNYRDAEYTVTIPKEAVIEPSVTYRWHIVDYGGNDVISDLYNVTVKPGITVGYSQDFESIPTGWTSYGNNNSWEWGKPTSGPGKAFSAEKVYATNLDGDYGAPADMTLMMPPIDLPEGETYLQFKQWNEFGYEDRGYVLLSTDRKNWRTLKEIKGKSDGWVDGEVRISQYAGQRVYIAFNVKTHNPSLTFPGWYLDNVSLSNTPLKTDTEPPTYDHKPLTKMYAGMNTPMQIKVNDNISVSQVELQYHGANQDQWKTVSSKFVQGDQSNGNGVYRATIPGTEITEPSITYRWHIVDYGGNEVTSDANQVPVGKSVTVGYRTDFESDPGWISFGKNNSWEWGVPTSGPGGAISGDKVYATNLNGNYSDNAEMTLMMPPIEVPDGNTFLQLKHWYKFGIIGGDTAEVKVSTDQEQWHPVAHFTGQGSIWQYLEVNLSDYAGKRIYVAYQLTSDPSMSEPGWYLDDVALSRTSIFDQARTNVPNKGELKKVKAKDTLKHRPGKETNEKQINPKTVSPGEPKNVKLPVAVIQNKAKTNVPTLPVNATVSVLEDGQFVKTDPTTGSYSMIHPTGTYTLKAEAYGFYSDTQSVTIPKDGTVQANFSLQPIPKGTVTGTVTNKKTGEPVAGATLMLMEDAAVTPVKTDKNGHYSITAYEGDYTLHVLAPKYYSKDIGITIKGDNTTEQNIQLKPFIGYPGEIGYDDGTVENARAFLQGGNRWAVKMSLPEGKDAAMITGGKFRFWTDEWPDPGGTDFQVEVWDASGKDGAPGKKLAGPVEATALRNGQWTNVDLSNKGIVVNGDFYIVYVQTRDLSSAPGLAVDENGPKTGHSWQMVGGDWSPTPQFEGNYMIRALVSYELTPPVITSPKDQIFTNDQTIKIEGNAPPTTKVNIFDQGNKVAETPAGNDGTFSVDIPLTDGKNTITATASTDQGTTKPSDPVTVVLDRNKPEIAISHPETDGKPTIPRSMLREA